jgi:hypothetical protein
VTRRDRELLVLHVLVAALGVILAATWPIGVAALVFVLVYDLAVVGYATWRRDGRLLALWWFAAVLSVWQLLPDQVLVELGTLVFPSDGVADIGAVTLPMAGLWTLPTLVVILVADRVHDRRGTGAALAAAAGTALLLYGSAEAVLPRLGLWEPVGVSTVGTVAVYILVAEVVLGVVSWLVWRLARERRDALTVPLTLLVTCAYTGAAVISWLLLEA